MEFLPADVVVTHEKAWFSKLIRWGEQHTGEEPTWASHVGNGLDGEYFIEALSHVVKTTWDNLLSRPADSYQVWRKMDLTDAQRGAVAEVALGYVGLKYGWVKIGLHCGDCLLGKIFCCDVYFFRRLAFLDKYPICSWETSFSFFKAIKYKFGVEPEYATPDHIHDWVSKHPEESWVRVL